MRISERLDAPATRLDHVVLGLLALVIIWVVFGYLVPNLGY